MVAVTRSTHFHWASILALVGLGLFALSQIPPVLPGPAWRLQRVVAPIWGGLLVIAAGVLCALGALLVKW